MRKCPWTREKKKVIVASWLIWIFVYVIRLCLILFTAESQQELESFKRFLARSAAASKASSSTTTTKQA